MQRTLSIYKNPTDWQQILTRLGNVTSNIKEMAIHKKFGIPIFLDAILLIFRCCSCIVFIMNIVLLVEPEVTSYTPNPYIVIEGQSATLKCDMTAANPNTSIIWRWYRTDRPNVVLFYGPNYTLPNIQRNMSGTYNCTASNSIGTSEANIINVEVQCEFLDSIFILETCILWVIAKVFNK